MAGNTLPKLRPLDRRAQPAAEHEAQRLQIDFESSVQNDRPGVVLLGAIVAFMVGLAIWGFLTLSIIAGIDSLIGESETQATTAEPPETLAFDCASFGAVRALSAEDEALFQAQCGASLPVSAPAAVPVSAAREAPAATADNRANCEQIRGTDYRSNGERTWFLANCIAR